MLDKASEVEQQLSHPLEPDMLLRTDTLRQNGEITGRAGLNARSNVDAQFDLPKGIDQLNLAGAVDEETMPSQESTEVTDD